MGRFYLIGSESISDLKEYKIASLYSPYIRAVEMIDYLAENFKT